MGAVANACTRLTKLELSNLRCLSDPALYEFIHVSLGPGVALLKCRVPLCPLRFHAQKPWSGETLLQPCPVTPNSQPPYMAIRVVGASSLSGQGLPCTSRLVLQGHDHYPFLLSSSFLPLPWVPLSAALSWQRSTWQAPPSPTPRWSPWQPTAPLCTRSLSACAGR